MTNRFTQHPERATNTGHAMTQRELMALSYFVLGLLYEGDPEDTFARVEKLDRLIDALNEGGIPEAMTLGDLLYMAT